MEKKDFSLLDILHLLKSTWWVLLIAAIVFGSAGAAYSILTYEEKYSSTVAVYVTAQTAGQTENSSDDVSEVKWAKDVVNSYIALLKTNDFMKMLSEDYHTKFPDAWNERDYTPHDLAKCTEFELEEDTYLFTFTVTTHSEDSARNIAKLFEELAPKKIEKHVLREAISIADPATEAEVSNSRNLARNTILGSIIGAILAFLVLLIVEVSDVRIKDEDDIIDTYSVPLLGSVPNFESAKKKGYGYGKK